MKFRNRKYCIEMGEVEPPQVLPEKLLILAIFERALSDVCSPTLKSCEKREAEAWLFSESNEQYSAKWWIEQIDGERLLRRVRELATNKTYRRANGVPRQKDNLGY